MTLNWPSGWPRTPAHKRKRAAFAQTRSYAAAGMKLADEIHRATHRKDILPEISTDLRLRIDGIPYATQPRPADSGVAVYFVVDEQPVAFACDQYRRVEDNLYAIARTIEAKRAIVRWGCATGAREFAGYAALPPSTTPTNGTPSQPLHEILGIPEASPFDQYARAYRLWVLKNHPDVGGNTDEFVATKAEYERRIGAR